MRPQQLINIGAAAGDGTGDPAREAFDKVNDNFTELYEQTTAIDKTVFSGTLIDAFLYDTSKDSDGGAWRKRCGHTSWENETLSGNWLGSAVNEAEARGLGGATTGSYYYDTTAAVFRTLNAGSGVTAAYRGNTRQFPAKVLITVEAARVIIWDLTQAGVPMWMVFVPSVSNWLYRSGTDNSATAVTARNGVICVAMNPYDLYDCQFARDKMGKWYSSAVANSYNGNVAARNSGAGYMTNPSRPGIVDRRCNDVAMTVLPNAPVDVATGLPVPTIAVATNGGVSVIKDDGNVWDIYNSGGSTYEKCSSVGFTTTGKLIANVFYDSGSAGPYRAVVRDIPGADVTGGLTSGTLLADLYYGNSPSQLSGAEYTTKIVLPSDNGRYTIAGNVGLMQFVPNYSDHALGMIAYVTKDYNSGWQVGAIKGAWLADTVAETLTGTELVTNGTFDTDTTGWTAVDSMLSVESGKLRVTNVGANAGYGHQAITTVVGKTYTLSFDFTQGTSSNAAIYVGNGPGSGALGGAITSGTGKYAGTFTATATTTYLTPVNLQAVDTRYSDFDNISCRLADVDRSVKAKGLQVFGSITKAAVASGAQLMGYSGFSAANFLEQPYNSDLDFGTGDFCIMGWFKQAATASGQVLFSRAAYSGSFSGSAIVVLMQGSSTLSGYISDDGIATIDQIISSASALDDSVWRFGCFVRRGSSLELWINATKAASDVAVANASGSLSNASATTTIGKQQDGTAFTTGTMALWHAGATAPSAEQIKHIYETERPLFEAGAQCCLAGTSNAVTALAYDDETDLLHVGTSYGRSAFKGLVRVASEATGVGAITALAAGAGIVSQAGATAVDVYVPAYLLREELLRDAEQMARFGQNLIAHDFTATASQTDFVLPVGWEIVAVYQQGALKRETTSWTRRFDGFKWSVVLGTGATVSDWISILAKRV